MTARDVKAGLLCAAFSVACHTQMPVAPQLSPITLDSSESAPITFTRLIVRIPYGTTIGHHHDGLAKVRQSPHTWSAGLTQASDEFRVVALEELRRFGYRARGGDNLLFGEDQSGKAEYQLGGTVDQLFFDTFGGLAGNYTEANLHVEWQVYDVFRRQVVFTRSTSGYAKYSGIGGAVLQDAFRGALRNIMADSTFVAIVRQRPSVTWAAQPTNLPVTRLEGCPRSGGELPGNIEQALDAVLVVRAGATLGSGVVVSPDGYALTAAHVVTGSDKLIVRMHSGLELSADVVRVDEGQDVALIKLPGRRHQCLPVHRGRAVGIGTELFAIGAPLSETLAFSVTKGIVSAFRDLEGFRYIQTDASLNPGNSGGPLVSRTGDVLGVVSWKIVAQGFEGLAFGVPIDVLGQRLAIEWP